MSDVKLFPFHVESSSMEATIPEGVAMIEAPKLWKQGFMGQGVVVAVIDTGCQSDHPDLAANILDGHNFVDPQTPKDYSDYNGHGTHIAGIIAAVQNHQGVIGVAPQAKLLVLKALSDQGSGDYQAVIQAIEYAIRWRGPQGERVRILSMSFGGREDDPELHAVIQKAVLNHILVVSAAGNMGDGCFDTIEQLYPGAYPEVIQVGATTLKKTIAPFSNSNLEVDLVAPGVHIHSTALNDGYQTLSGTSMAAPHVTGSAALLINKAEKKWIRDLSLTEIVNLLFLHTEGLEYPQVMEGHGLLKLSNKKVIPRRL